jgi:Gpi18-like mannosyltransferase
MDRIKLKPWQQVTLLWLAWALILNGFQAFLTRRLAFARPDSVLDWTAQFTSQDFLNSLPAQGGFWKLYTNPHIAWDSNYYLSIAAAGYDDPHMPTVQVSSGENLSRSYAFLPLYPLLVRLAAAPLGAVLPPQPALLWAGVLVSLLGTLIGAVALAEMAGTFEGDGLRAAFYLLVFPSAFFLSQVYTEGLFVGLAFGCLALVARRQWMGAALLATAACFTRTGVGLILTMAADEAGDRSAQR